MATIAQLQKELHKLNRQTASPVNPYKDGKAQIGCYWLSQAYGGYNVNRIVNSGGGCSEPAGHGHVTKRDCLERIKKLRIEDYEYWAEERYQEKI
mgnify:CR=1